MSAFLDTSGVLGASSTALLETSGVFGTSTVTDLASTGASALFFRAAAGLLPNRVESPEIVHIKYISNYQKYHWLVFQKRRNQIVSLEWLDTITADLFSLLQEGRVFLSLERQQTLYSSLCSFLSLWEAFCL